MGCAHGGPIHQRPAGFDPFLQARAAVCGELPLQEMIEAPSGVFLVHTHFHGSSQGTVFRRRGNRGLAEVYSPPEFHSSPHSRAMDRTFPLSSWKGLHSYSTLFESYWS